jgi:hypothetical protein
MNNMLTWTKGLFDSNYQLFTDDKISGSLLFDTWKNEAKGIGLTSTYLFKTEGFLKPITNIVNDQNELVGTITYGSWQTKATIKMASGEIFGWSFTGSWLNSWGITDFKDKNISYHSQSSKGIINSSTTDESMLLIGIFIREFYARILIFCIALLIIPSFVRIGF